MTRAPHRLPAPKAPRELVELLEESLRWGRDHKGEKYKHAIPCNWCLEQGLAYGIASYTGQTVNEVLAEYKERITNEKRAKAKVVRRRSGAAPTRKIVRRKK